VDQVAHHIVELELVLKSSSRFDIIHFHIDYLHFPLSRRQATPHLTTLHGRLDIPDLVPLYQEFAEVPVISISDAQRQPLSWLNWQGTVYHGLPEDLYRFHETPGTYLAFLGRISPEKRVDRAVEIAKGIGMELKIAAKVDAVDRAYFERTVAPLLEEPLVEYIGEIGDSEKDAFLGNAYALLFPIDWPEPFGLVMIEAMACGTPVIAYRHGSIPEVIEDGVTGFIVDGLEDAITAAERIATLSRKQCRRSFEQRFSVSCMATDYLAVYQRLIESELTPTFAA
jgi:glycosyltransferase involved in cell wall biosynthesis